MTHNNSINAISRLIDLSKFPDEKIPYGLSQTQFDEQKNKLLIENAQTEAMLSSVESYYYAYFQAQLASQILIWMRDRMKAFLSTPLHVYPISFRNYQYHYSTDSIVEALENNINKESDIKKILVYKDSKIHYRTELSWLHRLKMNNYVRKNFDVQIPSFTVPLA